MGKRSTFVGMGALALMATILVAVPSAALGADRHFPADHEPDVLLMSPTSFDFGDVQIGETVMDTADITNVSGSSIVMSGAGGAVGAPFQASQNCQGQTLNPGESCQMFFRFTPTEAGPASTVSNISWNGQAGRFAMKGVGVAHAFRISPIEFDFGWVEVGDLTAPQTANVTNVGQAPVTVNMAGGAPPGDFSASQNCQGVTLAVGESCQVFYRFSPQTFGPKKSTSAFTINGQAASVRLLGIGHFSSPPPCTIVGTSGPDLLIGTAGPDVICGFAGDDEIRGMGGNDVIYGGDGFDRIFGGVGTDYIEGNAQGDYIIGGFGADTIIGGHGNDELRGAEGHDEILGNGGRDKLFGGKGNDELFGGAGIDTCDGGPGNNTIAGC